MELVLKTEDEQGNKPLKHPEALLPGTPSTTNTVALGWERWQRSQYSGTNVASNSPTQARSTAARLDARPDPATTSCVPLCLSFVIRNVIFTPASHPDAAGKISRHNPHGRPRVAPPAPGPHKKCQPLYTLRGGDSRTQSDKLRKMIAALCF